MPGGMTQKGLSFTLLTSRKVPRGKCLLWSFTSTKSLALAVHDPGRSLWKLPGHCRAGEQTEAPTSSSRNRYFTTNFRGSYVIDWLLTRKVVKCLRAVKCWQGDVWDAGAGGRTGNWCHSEWWANRLPHFHIYRQWIWQPQRKEFKLLCAIYFNFLLSQNSIFLSLAELAQIYLSVYVVFYLCQLSQVFQLSFNILCSSKISIPGDKGYPQHFSFCFVLWTLDKNNFKNPELQYLNSILIIWRMRPYVSILSKYLLMLQKGLQCSNVVTYMRNMNFMFWTAYTAFCKCYSISN